MEGEKENLKKMTIQMKRKKGKERVEGYSLREPKRQSHGSETEKNHKNRREKEDRV